MPLLFFLALRSLGGWGFGSYDDTVFVISTIMAHTVRHATFTTLGTWAYF